MQYSSKDDIANNNDVTKTTPRFGTISSPSVYRPSYSGGTYRSIKRDASTTPASTSSSTATTYTSKYSTARDTSVPPATTSTSSSTSTTLTSKYSSARDPSTTSAITSTTLSSKYTSSRDSTTPSSSSATTSTSKYNSSSLSSSTKEPKEKDSSSSKKLSSTSSKYGSTKNIAGSIDGKTPKRYSGSSSLSVKEKNRESLLDRRPTINISSIRSRDPSPAQPRSYIARSRDPSPAIPNTRSSYLARSRDPSPVVSNARTYIPRSRDPSPVTRSYVPRSRDPSPVVDDLKDLKERFGLAANGYSSAFNNKLQSRRNEANAISSKYGSSATSLRPSAGAALSYMTASDATARYVSRRTKKEKTAKEEVKNNDNSEVSVLESSSEPTKTVSIVSRGTSPTPPATSGYLRSRRTEMAKTIEKTVQRPIKKPKCEDKEIQSDRLDDPTKYSRFGSARISSWSPNVDTNYNTNSGYSRYNNTNGTSSSTSGSSSSTKYISTKNEKEKNETDPDVREIILVKSKETSPPKVITISRSGSTKSSSSSGSNKTDKSRSSSDSSKSSTKSKTSSSSSKQKSPENARALPPQAPKSESPVKTVSSSTGSFKWTNKDFRKSALNVGPTDRPRKASRTSSMDREIDENVDKSASPLLRRSERSPSTGSEVSSSGTATTSQSEDDASAKLQKIKTTSQTSLLISSAIDDVPKNDKNYKSKQNDFSTSSTTNDVCQLKTDEGKSFLIRALEPVTNLFKSKSGALHQHQQDNNEEHTIYADDNNSTSISESLGKDTESLYLATKTNNLNTDETDDPHCWMNNNNNYSVSETMPNNDFGTNMKHKLRHIDSGEIAWWMNDDENNNRNEDDNDDTIADDLTLNQSEISEKANSAPVDSVYKLRPAESGERAWWLSEDTSAKEDSRNKKNLINGDDVLPAVSSSKYRISHVQSGERAWWLSDSEVKETSKTDRPTNGKLNDTSNTNGVPKSPSRLSKENSTDSSNSSKKSNSVNEFKNKFKIRHVDSGEKAWWMQDDTEIKNESPQRDNNINTTPTITTTTTSETNSNAKRKSQIDYDELGDRASPEGLEDTSNKGRRSPYDNIESNGDRTQTTKKLFISRHTNIDDLLGGSCYPISPLSLDRYASNGVNDVFEEITPAQVRIHDSTAKMPVIQRMQSNR